MLLCVALLCHGKLKRFIAMRFAIGTDQNVVSFRVHLRIRIDTGNDPAVEWIGVIRGRDDIGDRSRDDVE